MNELDGKRRKANREILAILGVASVKWPSMRFGQILETLGVVHVRPRSDSDFVWDRDIHMEPWDVLARIKASSGYRALAEGTKADSMDTFGGSLSG